MADANRGYAKQVPSLAGRHGGNFAKIPPIADSQCATIF
ncbi:hypothetical protein ENHAE0001_1258 [Enhydrobacter aerosaccus SK60]|nr:hypothetical protein ENHAE0001_1258 [Enhydrobacter aerosaccus SK60]